MMIGTHQRVFDDAHYCPNSAHTLVPGVQFDNETYAFMGKGQAMHILLRGEVDKVLASYPRDLTMEACDQYSEEFLSDLGQMTSTGTRQHCVYPVPDTAFVWHKPKAMVVTRSQAAPKLPEQPGSVDQPREQNMASKLKELAEYHHLSQPVANSGGEIRIRETEYDKQADTESKHQQTDSEFKQGNIKPPDKFHAESEAMTTAGPCIVKGQPTFPEACEPTLPTLHDLAAHARSAYGPSIPHAQGRSLDDLPAYGPSISHAQGPSISHAQGPSIDMSNIEIPEFDDEKTHNIRSKARSHAKIVAYRAISRGPSQYMVWDRGKLKSMTAGARKRTRKRAYTQIDHQAPAATLPHKVARGLRYVPPPPINREDAADVLERWSAEAAADEAIEAAAEAKGIEAAAAEAKGIEAAADEAMGGEGFDEAAGVGEDIGELNDGGGEGFDEAEEHEADDGAAAEGDGIADDAAPEDYAEGDEPDDEEDIDIGGAGSLENIGVLV